MSSDSSTNFETKDPIRALYLAYQAGADIAAPLGLLGGGEVPGATIGDMTREDLIKALDHETHGLAAWMVLFHGSVGDRLNLNPTDQKCLEMIWRSFSSGTDPACMTPGQIARETKLTTGAVTGVLDRLEQAGYVHREHDPDDRRRIIVRPVPERIKADVRPLFDAMSSEFEKLCAQYSEEELRRMVEFSRRSQELLKQATERLRELG